MRLIHDRVAGLDVHRDEVVACARVVVEGQLGLTTGRFATTAVGLTRLARWLADHEATTVVMQATGVYWKPVATTPSRVCSRRCGCARPST